MKHLKILEIFILLWSIKSNNYVRLCTGGELFEHITNEGHFNEKEA